MKPLEQAGMKGTLHIKIFKNNQLIEEYTRQNLIVTNGKTAMALLIGGGGATKAVTKISFGTDGSDPTSSDTSITSPYTKAFDSVSYPDASSVRFNWSLGTGEANGKTIQELGLLCSDNTLFARRSRAAIVKTSDLRLEGTWTINF